AMAFVVALTTTDCAPATVTRGPLPHPTRARAFVNTFDRVLVAGFLADHMSDRGRDLDINDETSRLIRMTLRSKGSFDVIETQPLDLRRPDATDASADERVLADVPFWRRLGEQYREPLILTGSVMFKPIGPQFEERTTGRRTVRLWRPGFSLELRVVFISGRTGQVLDSVSLGPVSAHALEGRSSALARYFELMDRLRPSLLAAVGRDAGVGRTHVNHES
ncbi:MAG: hypothetical protein ACRD2A_08535, partial [Vicinamibacterales bacterium]